MKMEANYGLSQSEVEQAIIEYLEQRDIEIIPGSISHTIKIKRVGNYGEERYVDGATVKIQRHGDTIFS